MSRNFLVCVVVAFLAASGCGDSAPQSKPAATGAGTNTPAATQKKVAQEPAGSAAASQRDTTATEKPGPASGTGSSPAPAGDPSLSDREVSLRILDLAGIQAAIAAHQGQVVVLDCWSTSCEPCKKEFPGLVRLHRTYPQDQVACMSLNLDYTGGRRAKPADSEPDVLAFLQSQEATLENILAGDADTVIYEAFKLPTIPVVLVYAADGTLARVFDNGDPKAPPFTYDDVEKLVKELLAAKKA